MSYISGPSNVQHLVPAWNEKARQTQSSFDDLIVHQDAFNQQLGDEAFPNDDSPENFKAEALKRISVEKRYEITLALLRRTDLKKVPALIQNLKPIDGVRGAVQDFLFESGINEKGMIRFNGEEIKQMFDSAARFKEFFPQAMMTFELSQKELHFALLTTKDRVLNKEILKEYRIGGEVEVLGVTCPILYQTLQDTLTLVFIQPQKFFKGRWADASTPFTSKDLKNIDFFICSLISWAFYQKQGHSTLLDFRGAYQFEAQLAAFYQLIDEYLPRNSLMLPRLQRRFLAENMCYMNANSQPLLDSMRNLAVRLENLPGFYSIRVEIHNLPTPEALRKTQEYAVQYKDKIEYQDFERLIRGMEEFLGISGSSQNTSSHSWEELVKFREENRKEPESIQNFINNRSLRDQILKRGHEEIQRLEEVEEQLQFFHKALTLSRDFIHQVVLDDMMTDEMAERYHSELESIEQDNELNIERKMELARKLLENIIDQVQEPLYEKFGSFDAILSHLERDKGIPIRFVDGTLRTHTIFLVGKLADCLSARLLKIHNRTHRIGRHECKESVEIFNPGRAEGTVRVNKNPMELKNDEIGVFTDSPFEIAPVQGIITLGGSARLSHLQLLAKSLKIPSLKLDPAYLGILKELEGKRIVLTASNKGVLEIREGEQSLPPAHQSLSIQVPSPDHSVKTPIGFGEINEKIGLIAGPKGLHLARMFNSESLKNFVPDGFIIPFGFFQRYIEHTGMEGHLKAFSQIKLENRSVLLDLAKQIRKHISSRPLPSDMLSEVEKSLEDLRLRTQQNEGFFFRSDTNIEDLAHFNGAGLNKTIPNVKPQAEEIDTAIRTVWKSAFAEKSIFWRARALASSHATLAEPSVVVMPTVQALTSGVIISKGGPDWKAKKGYLSANWGIGSVVEAAKAVEEITFESKTLHRFSFSVSSTKPVADPAGGLIQKSVEPGQPVLSENEAKQLNRATKKIEEVLGSQPHGWDIEWAYDQDKKLRILQARPNM